jgi:ribosomal-protein-alanine N-acetyltransferase
MVTSTYLFQTPRLGFRLWRKSDTKPFIALNRDPDVRRYFPQTLTAAQSKLSIRRFQQHHRDCGYGLYAIDYLPEDVFIGFIGFNHTTFEADFTPCVEIGWRLTKAYWGKGLATEGAKACLQYGFSQLGFRVVYSFAAIANVPSIRVMQKVGMRQVGTFMHPRLPEHHPLQEHVLYYAEAAG